MRAAFPITCTTSRRRLGATGLALALLGLSAVPGAMAGLSPLGRADAKGPDLAIVDQDVAAHPQPPARVAVVGDSLIATTAPEQEAELRGRGYDPEVLGNPGKPLTDPWIRARLQEAHGADIVVIATASNDNVQLAQRGDQVGLAQARGEYAQTVRTAIERVAARCTVVVDVREATSPLYRPETASLTNMTLREAASARLGPTVVVDWSTQSAGHDRTDWFVDDELHFFDGAQRRDAGVTAYAAAIADGVDDCRARIAGQLLESA